MKLFLFNIAASIMIFSCSGNSGGEQHQNISATANTEIEFTEEVHDFGLLTAGEVVVFTFTYRNTGHNLFRVTKISTDCGCIKARAIQTSVPPAQSGQIEVEFDTSGLHGKQYKTIELHGNSKDLKHLAIFAQVKNEMLDIKY